MRVTCDDRSANYAVFFKSFAFIRFYNARFAFLFWNAQSVNVALCSTFINDLVIRSSFLKIVSSAIIVPSLLLKKNVSAFSRSLNANRARFARRRFIFKNRLRFSKFASFLSLVQHRRSVALTSRPSRLVHSFLLRSAAALRRNWIFIIGGFISPFCWATSNKKKWLRRHLVLNMFKNNFTYLNKKTRRLLSTTRSRSFFKKLFINSFFYINKFNVSWNDLAYFARTTARFSNKVNQDWALSRPYLFLNSGELYKTRHAFVNSLAYNLYKNYCKVFNVIKRSHRRPRRAADFFYKYSTRARVLVSSSPLRLVSGLTRGRVSRRIRFNFKSGFAARGAFAISQSAGKHSIKRKAKFLWAFFRIRLRSIRRRSCSVALKKLLASAAFRNIHSARKPFFLRFGRRTKRLVAFYAATILSSRCVHFCRRRTARIAAVRSFRCVRDFSAIAPALRSSVAGLFIKEKARSLRAILSKSIGSALRHPASFFFNYTDSAVYKNLYKLALISKEKTAFCFDKHGFLFLTETLLRGSQKTRFVYNARKILYTFMNKNEMEKYIMRRYSRAKLVPNKLFSNVASDTTRTCSNTLLAASGAAGASFFSGTAYDIFNQVSTHFSNLLGSRSSSLSWGYFNSQFSYWKNYADEVPNVNIRRVRFKPGYMSQWRQARSVLKVSMNLKFRYQYRLTRYLSRYSKFIRFRTYAVLEMQLVHVVLRARFLPDKETVKIFLQNNLVFLNGAACANPTLQVFVGDFIQLVVSIKFYILAKWLLNWTLKKRLRLRGVTKRKAAATSSSDEKQRSRLIPHWVLFSKNAISDVAKYVEVDYFTLSLFVLYEPFLWSDLDPYSILGTRFSVINMYNWKYIV